MLIQYSVPLLELYPKNCVEFSELTLFTFFLYSQFDPTLPLFCLGQNYISHAAAQEALAYAVWLEMGGPSSASSGSQIPEPRRESRAPDEVRKKMWNGTQNVVAVHQITAGQ